MRKSFFVLLLLLNILAVNAQKYTVENIPNNHLLNSNSYVSNPDNIISSYSEDEINRFIAEIEALTTVEIAVVLLNSVENDEDIDLFGTDLFEKWGIGKANDNGLLFLLIKDQREMIFRTGYGLEGVLPDIYLNRIIKNIISPKLKEGDFDTGIVNGIEAVCKILKDPSHAEELTYGKKTLNLSYILIFCILIISSIWFASALFPNNVALRSLKWLSFLFALPIAIILFPLFSLFWNKYLRYKPIKCSGCGSKMQRLKESEEDKYLKQSQISEESVKSIDYDVWLCSCGKYKIKKYDKSFSKYTKCRDCKAKTCYIMKDEIITRATLSSSGRGMRIHMCKNCNLSYQQLYSIPRITYSSGSDSSSGGGSSSSGGSWGGGSTGGGGARGGW